MKNLLMLAMLSALTLVQPGCPSWNPPQPPKVAAPDTAIAQTVTEVVITAVDTLGPELSYLVSWGDNEVDEWTASYPALQPVPATHVYRNKGTFGVTVKARKRDGAESDWSDPVQIAVTSQAPVRPMPPSGSDTAYLGLLFRLKACASDPDGDSVSLRFDWGDSTVSMWSQYVASGESVCAEHRYSRMYNTVGVRVQARDRRGARSLWSERYNIAVVDPWQIVLEDGFENDFPTGMWTAVGTGENPATWDDDKHRPYTGRRSLWCAGSRGNAPGYPPDVYAIAIYGPFSLAGAVDGFVTFQRWVDTEEGFDDVFWGVSTDGSNFGGWTTTGTWPYWECETLDFKDVPFYGNVCGQDRVYVGFVFYSDCCYQQEGVYVDDVKITKLMSDDCGAASVRLSGRNPKHARPALRRLDGSQTDRPLSQRRPRGTVTNAAPQGGKTACPH